MAGLSINVCFHGHSGSGTSSLMGRLLYECGGFTQREKDRIEKDAVAMGKPDLQLAWLIDRLKSDREYGKTTVFNCSYRLFVNATASITMLHVPGDPKYRKNLIKGICIADYSVIVISAELDKLEENLNETQLHLTLARTTGTKQIIVVVNKLDLVDFSSETFAHVSDRVSKILRKVGYKPKNYQILPISVWMASNLLQKNELSWFEGPTLLEALQSLDVNLPRRCSEGPFRMVAIDSYYISGIGVVVTGQVVSGKANPGVKIIINGARQIEGSFTIFSIEKHYEALNVAEVGACVGLNIKGLPNKPRTFKFVKPGDVIGTATEPPRVTSSFIARIKVLKTPTSQGIKPGYSPVLNCHLLQIPCKWQSFISKTNNSSISIDSPQLLEQGDSALIEMVAPRGICVEEYAICPTLGTIIIRDHGDIIAIGRIEQILSGIGRKTKGIVKN